MKAIIIKRAVLSEKQCDSIVKKFQILKTKELKNFGGDTGRLSTSADVLVEGTAIGKKLYTNLCDVNGSNFKFELIRYPEQLLVTEYKIGHFCGKHFDGVFSGDAYGEYVKRKLSMVILLSEPYEDFKGGILKFDDVIENTLPNDQKPDTLRKGDVIYFPSFLTHSVSKVLSGVRYTGVMFCEGKRNFR